MNPISIASGRKGWDLLVERDAEVSLEIADLRGNLVARIPARWYKTGRHNLDMPESMPRNGIYFARLNTGGKTGILSVSWHNP
jgi:hypothetical protein